MIKIPTAGSVAAAQSIAPTNHTETKNFFLPGSDLPENKQKFCRCVLKVGDKQRGACNTEQAWFETRSGKSCYNPYSVCAKTTKTTSRECGSNYDFDNFSDNHLITYAQLHQKSKDGIISIPEPYNRTQMLENIRQWKKLKNK